MIFSSFQAGDNPAKYHPAIRRALEVLRTTDFSKVENGDHPIEGEDPDMMFLRVFDITSKQLEDSKPELHKEHIDVQFWICGEELCGVAPVEGDPGPCVGGNEADDLYFYDNAPGESFIRCWKDCYAIFFPNDFHRPGICIDRKPTSYRKALVKIHTKLLEK